MLELQDEVRALMRVRRHVPYNEENTFGINASDTLMSAWQNLTGTIFAVTIGWWRYSWSSAASSL